MALKPALVVDLPSGLMTDTELASQQNSTQHQLLGLPNPAGIINCTAYSRLTGLCLGEVPLCDVSETLDAIPEAYIWIGLYEPSEMVLREIQREFDLHELALEDSMRPDQRSKVQVYEDCIFVVAPTAQIVDGNLNLNETGLFIGERFLISIRKGASLDYQGVRMACEKQPQRMKTGPAYGFYSILDFIVDQLDPATDYLNQHFRQAETQIFSGEFNENVLRAIYELKSDIVRLGIDITPLKDICSFFAHHDQEDAQYFPSSSTAYFHDIQDHVLRVLDVLNALSTMTSTALDVYITIVGFSQDTVVKKLAAWGALLGVPTLIASIYGMNFKYMPAEIYWEYGYYVVGLIVLLICIWLYRKFKKAGWL